MGRPSTRPAPKSGAALRYERQRREATEALRAQAAQVREIRAAQAEAAAGETGGEFDIGISISEQDQQVEAVAEVRVEAAPVTTIIAAKINTPPLAAGTYRIADLRAGQCRYACTGFNARPHEHRFCGEPVACKGGKPTSWCRVHLPVVTGAPGRHAGGASVADLEREAR